MRPAVLVVLTAFLLLGGVVGNSSLYAQALPTATKKAEIAAFGGYTVSAPDFGTASKGGFLTGADFTIFPHWHFDPSVETRLTYSHAPAISEHSFLVGPRAQFDFLHDHLHPYADVLFGSGVISYHPVINPGDTSDRGLAVSYGGGVDFDITRHLSLKGDLQQQSWNLGKNSFFKPQGGNYTLSPRTYSFGVTYHFQFRGLNKQTELR
jgi:hypothetical protein